MGNASRRDIEKLGNQRKRADDLNAIARAVGQHERMSFLRTELARTDGTGFIARQELAAEAGIIAARLDRLAMGQMASECNTQAELALAREFAEPLHNRSVRAYDEFVAKAFGQ